MTETIAILTQKGALSKGIQNNTTVNILLLITDGTEKSNAYIY